MSDQDADLATVRLPFAKRWPILAGVLAGICLRLIFSGPPGAPFSAMTSSFILLAPVLVGAVTVYMAEIQLRRSWVYYASASFLANVLFVVGTMAILIEGLICAILIVPLFALVGMVSGLVMGAVCRATNWPRHAVMGLAVLPLALAVVEHQLPLPVQVHTVERVVRVHAPPEQVWQQIETVRDIRPDEVSHAWIYRIGVPLPRVGVTEFGPEGPVRRVEMGKGVRFEQLASEWNPPHRVRWAYRFGPDSFPPAALDDHVKIGGHYFDLQDTEYSLTPAQSGTDLRIRMRYRVSTQFNWYAQPIAEWLIGNFSEVILDFYAGRAERTG